MRTICWNAMTKYSNDTKLGLLSQTGSHIKEDGCPLGCSAVQSGRSLPTFHRSLLPPSSGRWLIAQSDSYCQTLTTSTKHVFWYEVSIFHHTEWHSIQCTLAARNTSDGHMRPRVENPCLTAKPEGNTEHCHKPFGPGALFNFEVQISVPYILT
jgi:hypothetical protein